MRSLTAIAISMATLGMFVSPNVFGQQIERGQNYDRIYQGLMDSQLNTFGSNNGNLVPVPQDQLSSKMRAARRGLQQFTEQTQQLYNDLRQEERYSAAIRTLVGEALQVRASAEVLERTSRGMTSVAQLVPSYEMLDQQWHSLAHRIQQWPGLQQNVYQHVSTLNTINQQLETLLKVAPQVESRQLLDLLSSMSVDFDRLKGDIEYDLVQHPKQRDFLQTIQRLQSMVYYLRQAVQSNHPHDQLVGRFKQMHAEWLPLKNEFRALDNRFDVRYLQRSMTRIAQANDQIHNILWIPKVIDGNEVLALANALKLNVDQIADQVSLRKLLESPNAATVFERTKEFYRLTGDFRQTVKTQTDLENLRWDFREMDVAWTDLRAALGHSTDPQVLQHVATVDFTVSELRENLGERPVTNPNETQQLIATIDSISELLQFEISRGVGASNQYDPNLRSNLLRSSQGFHRLAHSLQVQFLQNANPTTISQGTAQLVDQWNELRGYLARVTLEPQTMRNAQQLAQSLAQLQVIY